MSWTDDISNFLKMEEELDLFNAEVDGVKFWERIRFQVYAAIILRPSAKTGSQSRSKSRFFRLKRLILSVIRFTKNPLLAPKADILFVCSSRRLLEKDGLWWDIYTDPISRSLDIRSVAVETHFKDTDQL